MHRFGAKIGPGTWKTAPSVNIRDVVRAFVVLGQVFEPCTMGEMEVITTASCGAAPPPDFLTVFKQNRSNPTVWLLMALFAAVLIKTAWKWLWKWMKDEAP